MVCDSLSLKFALHQKRIRYTRAECCHIASEEGHWSIAPQTERFLDENETANSDPLS